MGYASIMVYVEDADDADSRVVLACDLAELFHARLIGVSASIPNPPVMQPYPGGAMVGRVWTQEQQMAEQEVQRAEGRFRSIGGGRLAELTWRGGLDDPAQFVACQGRIADLIVLGPELPWPCPCNVANPGDVLMAAGRPVLVTPPHSTLKSMLAHVLIAWKDCRESRRALADALPLLGRAGKITIIGIADEGNETANRDSVDDVSHFLHMHGKEATALAISSNGQPTAEQLLAYAKTNEVGLIVLGGYGHTRAREWIFGGVTRSFLRTSPVCCLFSH
jgi:nucleotide-binding universal stress UspA family protein